jgi:glyoxylase-like metal-dependent hydrolase (beta-lactamase superfamily II)
MKLRAAAAGIALLSAFSGATIAGDEGFKHTAITDTISMLQGRGGNVAVIEGEGSLLVIDDDYADAAPVLYKSILGVADKPIRFLVNTHWHFDHAGGNEFLGGKTNLVAHDNVRTRLKNGQEMKAFNTVIPPAKDEALPVVTYEQSMTLYEAGQSVQLKHFPNGHTDGDSVVFIQPANIVHMGDHYFQGQLPFVDLESGGSVEGLAANIAAVLRMIDDQTVVIPGHGPLSNKKELAAYQQMLGNSISLIQQYKKDGLSLDDIKKRGLSKEIQAWATGFVSADAWLTTLYHSVN